MNEKEKERIELERRAPETANPFQMMRRFTKDMERMFEDFRGFGFPTFFTTEFLPFRMGLDKGEWLPQMEVFSKNGQFLVRVDLPGLTKDDVKIEVTDKLLTICGERKEETEEKGEGFFRSERSYGSFCRQIPLPQNVITEKAVATFNNGVLEITIPAVKVEPVTRKLEITAPIPEKAVKAAGV